MAGGATMIDPLVAAFGLLIGGLLAMLVGLVVIGWGLRR